MLRMNLNHQGENPAPNRVSMAENRSYGLYKYDVNITSHWLLEKKFAWSFCLTPILQTSFSEQLGQESSSTMIKSVHTHFLQYKHIKMLQLRVQQTDKVGDIPLKRETRQYILPTLQYKSNFWRINTQRKLNVTMSSIY